VYASVKSPVAGHQRRQSQIAQTAGPGVDPDVDRMLEDDRQESPPYSPSDETDPSVVWRGQLSMNSVAEFPALAKHAGGVNLSRTISLSWTDLFPKRLTVAGRIEEQKATEYLCGLRYSTMTDVVVTVLAPATEAAKAEYMALYNYFTSKKRYGVIGEKGVGNVRDTYLVPVSPGPGNLPEFMLNLEDNFLPESRTEPLLLGVFVYRNDPTTMEKLHGPNWDKDQRITQSPVVGTPTITGKPQRQASVSGPAFSPTTPQLGTFPASTPIKNGGPATSQAHVSTPAGNVQALPPPNGPQAAQRYELQRHGEATAKEILGEYVSCPTVQFLLPEAHGMSRNEWQLVRSILERDAKARDDLQFLSLMISKAAPPVGPSPSPQAARQAVAEPPKTQTPVPVPHVPHSAMHPPKTAPIHPSAAVTPSQSPPVAPAAHPPQVAPAAGAPPA